MAAKADPLASCAPLEKQVRRSFARHSACALITQRVQVQTVPKMFTGSHQHGAKSEMHLIDQARLQKLPDGADTAANANVQIAGCFFRAFERRLNPVSNEMKFGSAPHLQ
jgi:hypothetical protein